MTQEVLTAVREESDALKADLIDRVDEMVEQQQVEQTHRLNQLTTDMQVELLKMQIGQIESQTEMSNVHTAMIESLQETMVLMRAENKSRYKLLQIQIDTQFKRLFDQLNAGRSAQPPAASIPITDNDARSRSQSLIMNTIPASDTVAISTTLSPTATGEATSPSSLLFTTQVADQLSQQQPQ